MKYFLILLTTIFLFSGCDGVHDRRIEEVYKERISIIGLFKNVSVFRTRLGSLVLLKTHSENKTNEYWRKETTGQFKFSNVHIEFDPDTIIGLTKDQKETAVYRNKVLGKIEVCLNKMDALGIGDVSHDMAKFGINLKIYMKSGVVILHVPDRTSMTHPNYTSYVDGMKRLDDQWYYSYSDH
jgi:hypothetical protein